MASKFDNRLKEFAERWEVDRYLSATGYLHPNAKPFFVALPKVGSKRNHAYLLSPIHVPNQALTPHRFVRLRRSKLAYHMQFVDLHCHCLYDPMLGPYVSGRYIGIDRHLSLKC